MKIRFGLIAVLLVMPPLAVSGQEDTTTQQQAQTGDVQKQQAPADARPEEVQKPERTETHPPAPKKVAKPQPAPTAAAPQPQPTPAPAPDLAAEIAATKTAATQALTAATTASANAAAAKDAVEVFKKEAAIESRLLRGLLIATGLLSLAAVVLLVIPLFRRKRPQDKTEEIQIAKRLHVAADKLDAALQLLDGRLEKTSSTIAARLAGASVVTPDQLNPIRAEIDTVRGEIARVSNDVRDIAGRPAAPAQDVNPVALERQVLGEWWKLFVSNNDLNAAVENAQRDHAWMQLLRQLTKVVPADLKPTFDTVAAPCEEHWNLLQKIKLVPRVADGKAGDFATPAEEVRRTREYAGLLQSVQNGSDAASRLTFRYKNWVTDSFLPFADQYLQRYQQARLDNRHHDLEPGVTLVRQLLRIAAVEPIDVTPGETTFDSTRHIGRSTSNDQRFADGVITGVVRNGFIEGGEQVIRQPEVIVNRTRP